MLCVTIADADEQKIYSEFREGPVYRAAEYPRDFLCNEQVGATIDEIAALRAECERNGFKWQGRLNWTAFAKKKQQEIDAKAAADGQ
jgi:hypothetical protein